MVYLADNPPARRQYRNPRRDQASGCIVVHTAENHPDLVLPDAGAEGVARFIRTRTDGPGSYHSIIDSDSILRLGDYRWEMFHEGTGGNRHSLGLSFACQAIQWPTLPEQWVDAAIDLGAREAANMARWVQATTGVRVPASHNTSADAYRRKVPGFYAHATLDPGRRSDPGRAFPWDQFLTRYRHHLNNGGTSSHMDEIKYWQTWLNSLQLGEDLVVDGQRGPKTEARAADAALVIRRAQRAAASFRDLLRI